MLSVRADRREASVTFKLCEINWRTVPEIPHIADARAAQKIPFTTFFPEEFFAYLTKLLLTVINYLPII